MRCVGGGALKNSVLLQIKKVGESTRRCKVRTMIIVCLAGSAMCASTLLISIPLCVVELTLGALSCLFSNLGSGIITSKFIPLLLAFGT